MHVDYGGTAFFMQQGCTEEYARCVIPGILAMQKALSRECDMSNGWGKGEGLPWFVMVWVWNTLPEQQCYQSIGVTIRFTIQQCAYEASAPQQAPSSGLVLHLGLEYLSLSHCS